MAESESYVVQAVWHQATLFTRKQAAAWCKEHDFSTSTYHRKKDDSGTITHHIHPQFDPDEAVPNSFRILSDTFPDGVAVTVCHRAKTGETNMDMIHKAGRQSDGDPFEFVLSSEAVDRMGDVIRMSGADLVAFEQNPIALYSHNHEKPIGVWENVRVVGKKLVGRLKLAAEGTSVEIDTLRKLVEQRILKAVSVGFQPREVEPIKKTGGYEYKKWSLHECSLVAVPANPQALSVAKSMGADREVLNKLFDFKTEQLAQIEKSLSRIDSMLEK